MRNAYLIYHPKRDIYQTKNVTVHHDKFGGNEDPYLWNDSFLHTYCHITQLPNEVDQINFWVSGDRYPNFVRLMCDCVFVVAEKHFWQDRNKIDRHDAIVENDQSFEHHYKWPEQGHHELKRRRRYTLKADKQTSFQPQDGNGELIDVLPFLNQCGITTQSLINGMTSKKGSRPFKLPEGMSKALYDHLFTLAKVKRLLNVVIIVF